MNRRARCGAVGSTSVVEKPLALTVTQVVMLAYTAGEHACLTMGGFQRRFTPAMTAQRARVETRCQVHTAEVSFTKASPDLQAPAVFYNGSIDVVTSDGVHAIDTLRWLCGGEAGDVRVSLRMVGVPGPVPNAMPAMIEFSTGAVGVVHYNLVSGRRDFQSRFSAINIMAEVDTDRESLIVADDGEPKVRSPREFATGIAHTIEDRHWIGFWHEHRHFIDCVKTGKQSSSNFADSARSMHLVDRLLHAARSQ